MLKFLLQKKNNLIAVTKNLEPPRIAQACKKKSINKLSENVITVGNSF